MRKKAHNTEKVRGNSLFWETIQRSVKSPSAKLGAILLIVISLACIFAPLVAPYGPNEIDVTNIRATPNIYHIFGTDALGRDIFSRLLYGGRYSLALGLCASLFGNALGVIIGSIAGYFSGFSESIIMRVMDIWASIPGILLCILVSTVLGPGFFNTILAISIGGVPGGVRMTRGQILAERSKEYLEAAQAINCSKMSIMFKHLLPNVISPTIVGTTMGIGGTITMAAGLSYIGLGIQPPMPEWGAILSDGRSAIREFPHMIMFPGLIIALTVLAVNLLGDGLRDALDPKLRS
jgi:ABC-type dipeptide/oligopeptide/nickel transport system permease subunit